MNNDKHGVRIVCADGIANNTQVITQEGEHVDFVRAVSIDLDLGAVASARLDLCLVGVDVFVNSGNIEITGIEGFQRKLRALGYIIVKVEAV